MVAVRVSNVREAVGRAAEAAAAELAAMGVPLLDGGNWGAASLFEISAESAKSDAKGIPWADYYLCHWNGMDFGVNRAISKALKKRGLFAEWINPGVLGVYPIN